MKMKKNLILFVLFLSLLSNCSKSSNSNDSNKESPSDVIASSNSNSTSIENLPKTDYIPSDFSISNNFIYYKENLFNGILNIKDPNINAYFTLKNGIFNGDYEINYIKSGFKENGKYNNNNLKQFSETNLNGTFGLLYDDNGKVEGFIFEDMSEKIFVNFNNPNNSYFIKDSTKYNYEKFSLISSNDKIATIIINDKNNFYYYEYTYTALPYKILTKNKFKLDSPKAKIMTKVEEKINYISQKNNKGLENFYNLIKNININSIPENTNSNSTNIENSNNNNISSNTESANPQNNNEDLKILDQVYEEVITKGNINYLDSLPKEKLPYIRNTLYARKGYIFKNEKYKNYFSQKSWYKGTTTNDNILNSEEKKLAEIIKSKE